LQVYTKEFIEVAYIKKRVFKDGKKKTISKIGKESLIINNSLSNSDKCHVLP